MRNRFIILGSICSSVIFIYLIILFRLQIIEQSRYNDQVESAVSRENTIEALRGRIYDRNREQALAYNVSKYQIYIEPDKFKIDDNTIHYVANVLEVSEENIKAFVAKKRRDSVVVRNWVSYEKLTDYIEKLNNIQGIGWKRVIQRQYPYGELMSHVVGYVGDISATELQTYSYQGYRNSDVIGKVGIERQYEEYLKGKAGATKESVNVFGQKVKNSEKILQNAEFGNDVVLTIDTRMQSIVAKAIGDRVGAAVVMRPASGEILAMVSYPTFDANLLVNTLDEKELEGILKDKNFPFLNRAIQSAAPPASAFKVMMTTAFLAEDPHNELGHWDMHINCPGYLKIGNRYFYCWVRSGHGNEDYLHALEDSCNVFFYALGTEILGVDTIYRYGSNFGFGELTGIDLPSEVAGNFTSREWKESRLESKWTLGDTANMSIGQGFTTSTPLQMAVFLSTILNEGKMVQPHILKEIRDQTTGQLIYETKQVIKKELNIDPKVFRGVQDAMRSVAVNGSSNSIITTKATKVAGKTGSAQVEGGAFENLHSWYISFGPYDAPVEEQIVVVVWIDAVNEWEWWAPKAANTIFQAVFADQTYDEAVETLLNEGAYWLQ